MYTINTKSASVSFDGRMKKSAQEPTANIFHIEGKDDVKALSTSEIIEVFNAVVKAHPELKINEVSRFATRDRAESRLWGLFLGLKANEDVNAAAVPNGKTVAKSKPKGGGERKIADKEVKKAAKTYPLRSGSMQEHAYKLIAKNGGITVDDFVHEMNKRKKAKYTRGNAWSALVYILHTNKGYGIRCKDGVFSLVK